MKKTNNFTLGIDMGTNSIGWALVEHDDNRQPSGLMACGTRIFQEAVDARSRIPKNQARRAARSARRLVARRKMRRITLLHELIKQKMLPENEVERLALFSDDKKCNPYFLRKRGLDEKLDLYEFGRILFHLNQRRGFKSNLKAQLGEIFKQYPDILELVKRDEDAEIAAAQERIRKRKEKAEADGKTFDAKTDKSDKDEGISKAAISQLQKNIHDSGYRTLGEYLWHQPKKRKTITDRKMYEDEFETLYKVQRQYHSALLTDDLRALLFSIIFHQRPLKTQKFLVGRCQFENSRKRATKALLEVQHFRILQDINNLKVKIPETRNERPLSPDERKVLFNVLNANSAPQYKDALNKQTRDMLDKSGKTTWGKVRKLLGGLHKGEKFNLEEGGKELIGNRTVLAMRAVLGEEWNKMPEERQKVLLTDLLTIDRKDALIKRLRGSVWNFSAEQAYKLAITEFEPGYSNLSLKAIRKIVPHKCLSASHNDFVNGIHGFFIA